MQNPTPQDLIAYHGSHAITGSSPEGFHTIESIFKQCYSFLDQHPREGIIVQIKHDWGNENDAVQVQFALKLQKFFFFFEDAAASRYWLLESTLPSLKALRNKIQLVRRYPLGPDIRDMGINAFAGWERNSSFTLTPKPSLSIHVQDNCNFFPTIKKSIINKKWDFVKQELEKVKTS